MKISHLLRPYAVVLLALLSHRTTAKRVFRPVALGTEFSNVDQEHEHAAEKRDISPADSFFGFRSNGEEPSSLEARDMECRLVHKYKDKCKFVKENCADEEVGFFDYLDLYYCRLPNVPAIPFAIMAAWLGMLFTTIGIAASDFFCINLSTISNILGMSESLAGVTFLAFGNGSPDVFSTFAAMKINSGSLAVGELIGAASFIATVVAGSMAIVRPFKVGRRPFVRDISFFLIAVLFGLFFLADGKITMWECVAMILFYAFYVCFVVMWHWTTTRRKQRRRKERSAREHYTAPEDEILLEEDDEDGEVGGETEGLLSASFHDFGALERGEEVEDDTGDVEEHEQQAFAELSNSMRIGRPGMERTFTQNTPHNIRPSLVGALEFRAVLNSLQKNKNLQSRPIHLRRYSDDPLLALRSSTCSALGTLISTSSNSDDDSQQEQNSLRPAQTSGRARAVSVNDAAQATVNHSNFRSQLPLPDINLLQPSPRSSQSTLIDGDMRLSLRIPSPDLLAPPPPHGFPNSPQTSPTNSSPTSPLSKPVPHSLVSNSESGSTSQQIFESPRPISNRSLSPPPSLHLPPPSLDSDSLATITSGSQWKRVRYWPYHILPPPQLLYAVLFPTLNGFRDKSISEKILGMIAVPSVFLLTITLPVVESDGTAKDEKGNAPQVILEPESPISLTSGGTSRPGTAIDISHTLDQNENAGGGHKEWNRWLVAVQCVTAPLFIALTLFSEGPLLMPVLYAILGGLMTLFLLLTFTNPDSPPRSRYLLCFVGFAVSISWISTVANEVVGVLKAFGVILGISDAILGLTIFAVGNSLGDLVADITVARLGFPVMALSACFGGPMLNILLGVGISGLYVTLSKADHQPYKIEVSSTIIISAATLLLSLTLLLVAVPLNHWRMSRRIGWTLIAFWVISTVVNLVVELTGAGKKWGGGIAFSGF